MPRATDAIKPKREILRNESYLLPGDSHAHARRDARWIFDGGSGSFFAITSTMLGE